jgi:hypothetical protein
MLLKDMVNGALTARLARAKLIPMRLKQWLDAERGRYAALATHLGVTPARISQIACDDCVPRDHMRSVLEFTAGEVSLEEMLPAVLPAETTAP